VLLYELLTGTTPFDEETLRKAAFDEMRRILREEDPPKPSTRLSVLGDLLTTTSAKRKADPRRLGQSLRGELDWIVMKALEKDRRRRYETANDFAADVMRHLTDQAVEACPPSAFYRFKKFAHRNRVALTTTVIVALALIAGGGGSAWQAIRANQARQETEGALATARQAVDEMYTDVAAEWLGGKSELDPLQRKFLEKALMFYEGFAARDGTEPAIRHGAADAADRVGNIRARLGLLEQAIVADRQALTLRKALADAHPENINYWRSLTGSYDQTANHLYYLGKMRESEQEHKNAIESIERILENDPTSTVDRNRLGMALINQGITLAELGRNREAEQVLQRSCDHFERLTKEDPGSTASYLNNRSFALSNLASLWREAGRFTEAEAGFKKVLEIQRLVPDASPEGQAFIGNQLMSLAAVYSGTRRHQESLDTYRQAMNTYEKVITGHPERHATRHRLILCRTNQAMLLMGLDRRREAEEAIQRFLPEAEKLVEDYPAFAQYREAAATVLYLMADLHSVSSEEHSDDPALAMTLARRAVEIAPESGMARQSLGWALYRTGDWKGCVESFRKEGEQATDYFLAMAYWRLGDKTKAREVFDRSSTWLVGYEQRWDRNPNVYPIPSMQRRVRAEAAALLGLDAATEGGNGVRPPEAGAAPK
jgi:tetratricopeptide (TPR) repeat protein